MSAFRPEAIRSFAYGSHGLPLGRLAHGPGVARLLLDPVAKRAADVILGSLFLLLAGLPMLVIAIVIRWTSGGPALFRQQRIGLNGQPFVMLKFRTMRAVPAMPGSCRQATRRDPRVTRVGAWLRRTSFDELPQLFNVLAGSMSLVGPRPHAPNTCVGIRPFEVVSQNYAARHSVKPGMTGLAQIRGWRGETDTEEKLLNRIESDLEYIATWGLWRDVKIIVRTVVTVLRMPDVY